MSDTWNETDLQYRIGTSFLAEFAAGHTPADVIRELIQNEYDAGGTVIEVKFGATELQVRGNGKPIDRSGWSRLSVMMGTGTVAGTETAIASKVNGIGSKNFGLRSLFLFGDRISIQSAGNRTILDRRKGTLASPVADPTSRDLPGVVVSVRYRDVDDGELRAFTPEREGDALADIARILGPSVIKLALPRTAARRIDRVVVRSNRLGRSIELEQSAKVDGTRGSQARVARVRLAGWDDDSVRPRYSETEYTRALTPPEQFVDRNIPSYFRLPGGRIRIGISFGLERGHLASTPGIFYYPLGAVRAQTGAMFSVSAPFAMNEDRSQLLNAGSSTWNQWLLRESATFAVSLLRKTLFDKHGPSAYSAVSVDPSHASSEELAEYVADALSTTECWPSRERSRGRPVFRRAGELTVPIQELRDVAGSLRSESVVSEEIGDDLIASGLAIRSGAKPFDTNSLVRFRCAGADASLLQTKIRGANWHYTNFPEAWRDLDRQVRAGEALDRVRGRLTPANRADLSASPTTLARSGDLAAPDGPLWVVDSVIEDAVPSSTALHPELAPFKVLRSLCRPFELSHWAIAVAEAAARGTADDTSVAALRRLLLTLPELSRPAWKALRQAPILVDHRGEPAAPADLIIRTTAGAALLEPVLHFAPSDVARMRGLVERLRIRTEVKGSDFVALAEAVEAGKVTAAEARLACQSHPKLLTPHVVRRLHHVAFLETYKGELVAPSDAYEQNPKTLLGLGPDHPWPLPEYGRLLPMLKCRATPSAHDILARLRQLAAGITPLAQAEAVYRLLHEVAKAERVRLGEFSDERIMWTGDRWALPTECLLGSEHRAPFGEAVPVLTRPREALAALGVPTRPTPAHWMRLFEHIGTFAGRSLPKRLKDALIFAYDRLEALPESLPSDLPTLLDESGELHTLGDASKGAFVINDEPALADAVRRERLPIAFAHPDAAAGRFFHRSGVSRLSELSRLEEVVPGELVVDVELRLAPKLLARLADPDFASAAAALGDAICGPESPRRSARLPERFVSIAAIDVVQGIERRHRIGAHSVVTHVDYFVDADRIVVTHVRTQEELRRAVARAVAAIIDESDRPDRLLPDAVYFLLRCATRTELARELEQRRIPWHRDHLQDTGRDYQEDHDEEVELEAEALGQALSRTIMGGAGATPTPADRSQGPSSVPSSLPPVRRELPPLADVSASFSSALPRPVSRRGSSGGGVADWVPRTPQQVEDDQRLGVRGEEIAFDLERRRIAARGQDPNEVIWVAETSPGANYDIRSIDERGREIWIEVKATAGRTGRFLWPKSEFLLAVAKRSRYCLHRVYEADKVHPVVVEIQDPFGRFESEMLRIDLDTLSADAGPLPDPSRG
jgi:hypothetical protein